jgi:hypothetical protein
VVDRQWKLLSNRDGSHIEPYEIAADPLETKVLASDKPDVVKEIVAKLEAWKAMLPDKPSGKYSPRNAEDKGERLDDFRYKTLVNSTWTHH